MICYSPPCQAFSTSGKQMGFEDERGILFFQALRIIEAKKPKLALMENVKGLTQKKFSNEFRIMLQRLDQAGYNNYWKVINAKDCGVPQNRERLFIISVRKDVDKGVKFPESISLKNELNTYLEDDAALPILHNIYGGFKEKSARIFDEYSPTIRTSAGGGHIPSVVVKGCSLRTRSYKGQPQKLEIRSDDLSNTVTTVPKDFMLAVRNNKLDVTELIKRSYKIAVKKNDIWQVIKDHEIELEYLKTFDTTNDGQYLIRTMTPRETFRIMDYTDEDFDKVKTKLNNEIYKGKDKSKTKLYRMAGNSIVVAMPEQLFKVLQDTYDDIFSDKQQELLS